MRLPWSKKPAREGLVVELRFPPDGPGSWRFSRLDGRFVYDYADGVHVGFASKTFCDVDPFARYVTALEAELRMLRPQH